MKLHGCNVVVKVNRDFGSLFVVEIGDVDDDLDRQKAFEVRKQILENHEYREKFEQYLTEGQLDDFGIDTLVCSKKSFEELKEKVEKCDGTCQPYDMRPTYHKLEEKNKRLKDIVDHVLNCHNCASIGWSNCKFYRQNLDKRSNP